VSVSVFSFVFFQAEDGIRDATVTGVQTCALPIYRGRDASRLRTFARLGARMERFHNAPHARRGARPPDGVRRCRSDQPATVDAADGLLQPQPDWRVRPLAGHRSGPVRDAVPSPALPAKRTRP